MARRRSWVVAGALLLVGCAGEQAAREPSAPVTTDRPTEATRSPACFAGDERAARERVRREILELIQSETDRAKRGDLLLRLAGHEAEEAAGCSLAASSLDPGKETAIAHLEGLARRARERARDAFRKVGQEDPDHPRADEALAGLAEQLMALGDPRAALAAQKEIVARYPRSRFVPHAYLAFGEYYFEKADLDKAGMAYRRVLEYPDSDVRTYARYKLAWCAYNLGDLQAALDGFAAVCEEARASPERGASLAREARKDWVRTLAALSPADEAFAAIQRLAPEEAVELLDRLAGHYHDDGKAEDARRARELRARLCAARPGGCPAPDRP